MELCIFFERGDIVPNSSKLKKNQEVVACLKQRISESVSGVLVDFRGVNVEQDVELRNSFRKVGVDYSVVKNTMLNLALEGLDFEELKPFLEGPTALATSSHDLVAPAKVSCEFAKQNENFKIKVGFIDGVVVSPDEIERISHLPSKDELIAKVLCGLNSPVCGFVNVLNGNITALVRVLAAVSEQKS